MKRESKIRAVAMRRDHGGELAFNQSEVRA